MSTVWCSHVTRQVDRALCPPPCAAIHIRCTGCGAAVGGCPFESEGLHERLVAVLGAQLPFAEEWQVRDLAELVERGGHGGAVVPLSRALAMVRLPGGGRSGSF
jgi:ferredoxin